jgi:hypothetical protein
VSFDFAIISRLRTRLDELKSDSVDMILNGRCRDIEAYRYATGYMKAINDAMVVAEEIAKEIQGEV